MNRPAERPPEDPAERRFAREAYLFTFEALQTVQDSLAAQRAGGRRDGLPGRHITAAELCGGFRELAVKQFGGLARTVLRQWGVTSTEDVGRIVFELVDRGELCKCDGDRPEDFAGLFDFDAAFAVAFDADLDGVALTQTP